MRKSFVQYCKDRFKDLTEALTNLFIFFPYFFSVSTLLKTLFFPWKNLITKKTGRGFDFGEWASRTGFNLVSRLIGFWMRLSVLLFFLILEIGYVLFLPFIFIFFLLFLPFDFLIYLLQKTDAEKKAQLQSVFIKNHLLKPENRYRVERWFEYYHHNFLTKTRWWKSNHLFNIPPLGRDWAVGYTPTLDDFCTDLTSTSYQGPIKRIFGREEEIRAIETALTKTQSANVIIIGEEGVGKHTLVDDLAYHIYSGQTNPLLSYKRVLKLNLEKILSQTTDQKQRENLFEVLLEEANEAKNVIILIDDFDKYIAAGNDRVDLSLVIEKMARSQHLQLIALTTPFYYQKDIFPQDRLSHIFTPVIVKEMTREAAATIMLDVALRSEKRYRLTIPYETVLETVDKSDFYITAIPFPEKAIDLLDHACSFFLEKTPHLPSPLLTPDIIDLALAQLTHTPTQLSQGLKDKLNGLETDLGRQIINQPQAVGQLAAALRRSFVLLGKRKKPLASFLFLGPTGVGKTETAKAVNRLFFGDAPLLRFDMSLYQTKQDIPNLIGSVQTGQPGLLTNALRNTPYGVLLLDEIEKADHDLLNVFLTILDEGYFTDGSGKRVDCKNVIVIATSNAGSDFIYQINAGTIGGSRGRAPDPPSSRSSLDFEGQGSAGGLDRRSFSGGGKEATDRIYRVDEVINLLISRRIFSPEFLNRFDGVVVYNPIDAQAGLSIARAKLQTIIRDIYQLYKVKIAVSDQLLQLTLANANYRQFGARDLERTLRQTVEDKIVKLILENKVKEGDSINL